MQIKGLAKIKKQLKKMLVGIENKIDDNHDKCGTVTGDRLDNKLNDAWMIIDSALNDLNDMGDV